MECSKLIEIAHYLGLSQIEAELLDIQTRQGQENPYLVLPLVGEFSSGKTTLINALTDSRKLETATKPTTATIYEIHFGCDTCRATVLTENDEFVDYDDITDLRNDALADAKVVTVFDTSNRVPSTTILVDTPGLSSPDTKHKQTLVSFLPKADAILLVVDINQQVTRSLTDFIGTMKLSHKPIFLVLTKADTKAPSDIESAKLYLSENCEIPIQRIAIVSAMTGCLDELYGLFDELQASKKEILFQVDSQRINDIVVRLSNHIDELTKASSSDKEMDQSILVLQQELNHINRKVDALIESVSDEILEKERHAARKFEDTVQSKLNALVAGKSANFDAEAVSMINSTATLLLSEFKNSVQDVLRNAARLQDGKDAFSSSLFSDIDMTSLRISGLSYNLNLNTMGHEYDGLIKTGLIAAAAIGIAVAAAPAAAGAAGAAGAEGVTLSQAGFLASGADLIDLADTVSDVSSIISNTESVGRIERASGFVSTAKSQYDTISSDNLRYGQDIGSDKGIIDSLVGLATDKIMSKPQRVREVRVYVESTLSPEFKLSLQDISKRIISDVREAISREAAETIGQKEASIRQLKCERAEKEETFKARMVQLKEFKTILSTINQLS